MTRSEIFKALATIDATYDAANVSSRTSDHDQLWEIRDAEGTVFHYRRARIEWAVDVAEAGVDILASPER